MTPNPIKGFFSAAAALSAFTRSFVAFTESSNLSVLIPIPARFKILIIGNKYQSIVGCILCQIIIEPPATIAGPRIPGIPKKVKRNPASAIR